VTARKVPRCISKSELARWCGVTRQRIGAIVKRGDLDPAMDSKGRVDVHHPVAAAWLEERGVNVPAVPVPQPGAKKRRKPKRRAAPKAKQKPAPSASTTSDPPTPPPIPEPPPGMPPLDAVTEVTEIAELTVREVIDRWGGLEGLSDWLSIREQIGKVFKLEVQNAQLRGQLVDRGLIERQVVAYIDGLHRRLLRDAARTLGIRTRSAVESGESPEAVELLIRDVLSQQIKGLKGAMRRALPPIDGAMEEDEGT
jgi:hypothetical protein